MSYDTKIQLRIIKFRAGKYVYAEVVDFFSELEIKAKDLLNLITGLLPILVPYFKLLQYKKNAKFTDALI